MFDGRTLKCQSSKSTETPSRCEIRPPSAVVALLELLELQRDIGDGRVDLAGDEVAVPERLEEGGERLVRS